MAQLFSRIIGTGAYLPSRVMLNSEFAANLNTSDEWIRSMTGIAQRHIAAEDESTTDMASVAATRALGAAGLDAQDLDLVILATITPDLVFPSTAAMLQARLGARHVGCFDLSAACSGFLYGLAIADAMITAGKCKVALVIGAERMSRLLDWNDRSTCVLFGDGAGAAVVVGAAVPGIRSVHLHADGATPDVLRAPSRSTPYLHMDGGIVYKFAVRGLVEGGVEALEQNMLTAPEVDWVIPHQANLRIIETATRKLGISQDKAVVTVDRHANTSAASIPLALDEAIRDGRIRPGNKVLLLSVGGGFTWASSLMDWS